MDAFLSGNASSQIPSEPMSRALTLARQGEGLVEPNPMVGCVIVSGDSAECDRVVGEGFHQQFGGSHAEVNALTMAGVKAQGATAYVTLEPCCHTGKTPPCTEGLIESGIAKVVIACEDPNPRVHGKGIVRLRKAGIECVVGDGQREAKAILAPFRRLMLEGRPWVIAKWAMSKNGRIATPAGKSPWISGETSRRIVHQLRGRVDGVLVGAGTLLADDPMLTARPAGVRTPLRIVLADDRPLPEDCQLFQTARETQLGPVLLAVGPDYPSVSIKKHLQMGVEVWHYGKPSSVSPAAQLLDELGRRQMTNLLVEGGGKLLDAWFNEQLIDEAHVFIAPQTIEGDLPLGPGAGLSIEALAKHLDLAPVTITQSGDDIYLQGRMRRDAP